VSIQDKDLSSEFKLGRRMGRVQERVISRLIDAGGAEAVGLCSIDVPSEIVPNVVEFLEATKVRRPTLKWELREYTGDPGDEWREREGGAGTAFRLDVSA